MDADDSYLPFDTYGSYSLKLYTIGLAYMDRLKPSKVSDLTHSELPHICPNYHQNGFIFLVIDVYHWFLLWVTTGLLHDKSTDIS